MKALFEKFPFLPRSRLRPSGGGRVVIVHWDQQAIDYLIVSSKSNKVAASDRGRVAWAGFSNPLLALAEHLRTVPARPQRLIVLLSRPLLEQLSLTLPVAELSELPELVAAEVEQQLGETDVPPIVDFYSQPSLSQAATGDGQHALAFSLAAVELERLRQWSQQASLRLMAVCSRELSPLGILRRKKVADDSLNISVHLVSGEAELAVCRGAEPVYLRLIRTAIDDPQRVADQVWLETQRCLTILPAELADLPQAWFVFTTCEAAWHVARSLEDRGVTVQPVDPLFGWQTEAGGLADAVDEGNPSEAAGPGAASAATDTAATGTSISGISAPLADESTGDDDSADFQTPDAETDEDDVDVGVAKGDDASSDLSESTPRIELPRQTSAANAGAAWEYLHDELPINMLAPKKAPKPPNPLHRWGAMAAAVLAVAGLGIYFLLADVNTLRTEVAELRDEVAEEKKLAAKFQEKADQVAFVETWLSDQVDWLAELNKHSARMPDGELATVRRLTASATGNTARVDLSLQVAHQENIAQLENRIRSAKYRATSQRISQNADSAEYPWQFETQIAFPVEVPQREAYVEASPAPQSVEKSSVQSAQQSTQVPAIESAADTATKNRPVATAASVAATSPSDKSPSDKSPSDESPSDESPPSDADVDVPELPMAQHDGSLKDSANRKSASSISTASDNAASDNAASDNSAATGSQATGSQATDSQATDSQATDSQATDTAEQPKL